MKKGQVSMEFILIFAMVFVVFVGFFAAIQYNITDATVGKRNQDLELLAKKIGKDISLSASLDDGLTMNISIPPTLNGQDLDLAILKSTDPTKVNLVVGYKDGANTTLSLPIIVQAKELKIGDNCVMKKDGFLYLNYDDCSFTAVSDINVASTAKICEHKSSCLAEELPVLRYSEDGHVQMMTEIAESDQYTNSICCNKKYFGTIDTAPTRPVVLTLSDKNDAHVWEGKIDLFETAKQQQLSFGGESLTCYFDNDYCQTYDTVIFSMNAKEDSHLGQPSRYARKFCCHYE